MSFMIKLSGKYLFERFFTTIFTIFSIVVNPYCFLCLFYGEYFKTANLAWATVCSSIVGLPITVGFYFLYRLLFKIDTQSDKIDRGIRICFRGVIAMYCGFAFVVPCTVKLVIPTLSPLEGILFSIAIHLVGLLSAVVFCIMEILNSRRRET
jgi:hypothetical protein